MSVNLYNFEPFDDFLSSFLKPKKYNYTPTIHFAKNNLLKTKSVYQVEQNREYIASAMLERYVYHNLKAFLLSNEKAPYFEKAVYFDYLPDWAKERKKDGKDVHIFCKDKISDTLKENIETICDFMYDTALSYVDKRIELFKSTQKKDKEIKINLDSLKTINEYADFNSLLNAAKKGDAYKRKQEEKAIKAAEFLKDSLYGTESVMAFDDGMQILELKSKVALDFESREMCHCVGDGEYDDNDGQKIDIFSLRDEKGHPHVTLELRNRVLKQCKAYGNKKPKEEYLAYIREFVQTNDIEISNDMKFLGMFKQDGQYYCYDNLPNGFVYKGMLDLSGIGLKKLPDMSHIEVTGSFVCDRNHLTDLKGAPYKVGGSFFVSSNSLKSLEGAPIYVGEDFYCSNNYLEDLIGAPREVGGDFICCCNELETLKGAPNKVGGDFDCSNNKLHSLKYLPEEIGGELIYKQNYVICQDEEEYDLSDFPKGVTIKGDVDLSGMGLTELPDLTGVIVEGDFKCSDNNLESLKGAPEKVGGNFDCSGNKIKSTRWAPREIGGDFIFSKNNIERLGIMPEVKGKIFYDGNPLVKGIIEQNKATYMAKHFSIIEERGSHLLSEKMLDKLLEGAKVKTDITGLNIEEIKERKFGKLK